MKLKLQRCMKQPSGYHYIYCHQLNPHEKEKINLREIKALNKQIENKYDAIEIIDDKLYITGSVEDVEVDEDIEVYLFMEKEKLKQFLNSYFNPVTKEYSEKDNLISDPDKLLKKIYFEHIH